MHEVGGGLAHLIETEARSARALSAAQAEAERVLLAARTAVEQAEAGVQEAIDRESLRMGERIAAERDAELSRINASAEERVHRYRGLPPATIEELALGLADRVLPPPLPEPQR